MKKHILLTLLCAASLLTTQAQNSTCTNNNCAVNTDSISSVSPLTDLAIYAANNIGATSGINFYASEAEEQNGLPDIFIYKNHQLAITDCSGWVSYAVSSVAQDAFSLINNTRVTFDGTPCGANPDDPACVGQRQWPLAFTYYQYFTGTPDQTYWTAGTQINQVQAGDIFVWCADGWCEGAANGKKSGDTGHIMVVLDAQPANYDDFETSQLTGMQGNTTYTIPEDGSLFMQLTVVDVSGDPHAILTNGDKTLVQDLRTYSSDADCLSGGLGAGVIYVAQWTDSETGSTLYAELFNNDNPNNTFYFVDVDTKQMAWGRLNNAAFGQEPQFLADVQTSSGTNRLQTAADLSNREHIEMVNPYPVPLNLENYTLADNEQVRHTFSNGTVLEPGQALVVYAGELIPTSNLGCALAVQASTGTFGFNQAQDVLILRNPTGQVADSIHYTNAPADGTALTRDPATGNMVPHNQIAGAGAASPGTQANGTPYSSCIEFKETTITALEGETIKVELQAQQNTEDTATFMLSMDQASTASPNDFVEAASLLQQNWRLETYNGNTLTFTLTAQADALDEPDETFMLNLTPQANSQIPIGPNSQLTINLQRMVVTSLNKNIAASAHLIYPNPATQRVTVKGNGQLTVKLMNLQGQEVTSTTAQNTTTINLSNQGPGLYLIWVEDKTGRSFQKLTIK